MNSLKKTTGWRALCALILGTALVIPAVRADNETEVLTRGPVHEAFAEPVTFEAEAGLIVSRQPAEAVEEMPPDERPEGDNITWIPGYWAWDDDRNDFIWISGIWRNVPPGREWVPGYWSDLGDGRYQWTSGYWGDTEDTEVTYISTAPPKSIDSGPNVEAPSRGSTWVPGNWYWSDTRYVWRPGYWIAMRENWTWVPGRYCWTRRGYVYVDGYWDYGVARRGMIFAPVYYRERVYTRPDYYYTPTVVVALNVFYNHLFVRPRFHHYYFGDYYDPGYEDNGFYASFAWHSRRSSYDPIYAYERWRHREDREWDRRMRDDYAYFRDHRDGRPPRTWAEMRDIREDRFRDGRERMYASDLASYTRENKSGLRFRKVDETTREKLVSQRQEIRKIRDERRTMESRVAAGEEDGKQNVTREKAARSPIAGKSAKQFAKGEAPPERPRADRKPSRKDQEMQRDEDRGKRRADKEGKESGKPQPGDRMDPSESRKGNPQRDGDKPQKDKEAKPQRKDASPQSEQDSRGRKDAAPQRDDATPDGKDGKQKRRDMRPPGKEEQPGRSEATPQRKDGEAQRKEAGPQRKDDRPQRKETKQAELQRREAGPERKQAEPQRREAAPERKQAEPQRREAAPERKRAEPQRREAAPERKQAEPQRREAAPQRKEAAQQRREAAPQRREAAPQRREAAPQRKEAAPQRKQSESKSNDSDEDKRSKKKND